MIGLMQFWISVSWHVRSKLKVWCPKVLMFRFSIQPEAEVCRLFKLKFHTLGSRDLFYTDRLWKPEFTNNEIPRKCQGIKLFQSRFPIELIAENHICGMMQLSQLESLSVRQMMHGESLELHNAWVEKEYFFLKCKVEKNFTKFKREWNDSKLFFKALLFRYFLTKLIHRHKQKQRNMKPLCIMKPGKNDGSSSLHASWHFPVQTDISHYW